jgi:hypothetical protein
MSSLSEAMRVFDVEEPDPRDELMQLCKRTDAVTSECNKTREKLQQMQNRTSGFVNAQDLDAARDVQAAMIAEMEDELAGVMHNIREAFAQRKGYELVSSGGIPIARGTGICVLELSVTPPGALAQYTLALCSPALAAFADWQISNRIKLGERSYGKELAAIDGAAAAKAGDIGQLKLMLRDAEHARGVARKDLAKLEEQAERERRQQRAALQERRRKLKARLEAVAACELRCAQRLDAIEVEHEAALARVEQVAVVDPAKFQAEQERIQACEEQFTQIKQILGVLKVDDIIEKFSQQEAAAATLEALIVESQGRIDALQEKRAEMKKAVEALRYSRGVAPEPGVEDAAERRLSQTERLANLKDGRQRLTRLQRASALLAEARVAIEHLGNVVSSSASLSIDSAASNGLGGPKAGLAGISLPELQEMLRVYRAPPAESAAEQLGPLLMAHMQALRKMHERVLASDLSPLPSVLVEDTGRGVESAELSEATSSPEVSPLVGTRERRRAFTAAESEAFTLAPLQGPILKRDEENWRVDVEEEPDVEEEGEDADPDDPTDPVVDRNALKLRAEREVKKHTKAANRLKDGRAGKKDEEAEA